MQFRMLSVLMALCVFATHATAQVWYHRSLSGDDARARFVTDRAECEHYAQTLSPVRVFTSQDILAITQRNLGCMAPFCNPEPMPMAGVYGNVQEHRELFGACMYQRGWSERTQ